MAEMNLTPAQRERARRLIERGIPEGFEGMPDDDALLVLMASGMDEENARLALAIERRRVKPDGTVELPGGITAQY